MGIKEKLIRKEGPSLPLLVSECMAISGSYFTMAKKN
jgi:hypothetical protein